VALRVEVKMTKFKPVSDTNMETGHDFDLESFKTGAIQGLSESKNGLKRTASSTNPESQSRRARLFG